MVMASNYYYAAVFSFVSSERVVPEVDFLIIVFISEL